MEAMKTVIIVQARMTSTRLPGKVLKEVLGKSLLEYQLERLRRCHLQDGIIIATTTNSTDDPIVDFCKKHGVLFFRGSEHDVLSRYHGAAVEAGADVVVRITSDCPLIDPAIVEQVIRYYHDASGAFDYVSNVVDRRYPRGMDTEVFSMEALATAHQEARDPVHREHVTPFIHRQPERFRIGGVTCPQDLSKHRWTVDTQDDFELIRRILEECYPPHPHFTMNDILRAFDHHPEWMAINAHVEQKVV